MSTLYGPLRQPPQAGRDDAGDVDRRPTAPRATTSSTARPACRATPPSRPRASRPATWAATTTDPRALQVPGGSGRHRRHLVLRRTELHGRRQPHRRAAARPGAVLRRLGQPGPGRAGADQRRGDRAGAEHAVDLVVPVGAVPGLRGQRPRRDHDHADGRARTPSSAACSSTRRPRRPRRSSSQDATTQGTWIGTYGAQGYDVVGGPASLPSYATVTPVGPVDLHLGRHAPPTPAPCRSPARRTASPPPGTPPTSFTRRRQPHRRAAARPGAVLRRLGQPGPGRAGAGQRRGDRAGAEHAVDLVVPVGGVPGLRGQRARRDHDHADGRAERRPQRPVPRPVVTRRRSSSQDTTTQGTWIGTYGAQGYDLVGGPVSLPELRHRHALGPVDLDLGRPPPPTPAPCRSPAASNRHRRHLVLHHQLHGRRQPHRRGAARPGAVLRRLGQPGRGPRQVQVSDAATGPVLSTQSISSFQSGVYLDYAVSGHIVITITRNHLAW